MPLYQAFDVWKKVSKKRLVRYRCFRNLTSGRRVARLLISRAPPPLRVPCPCAFCEGGYDAAASVRCALAPFSIPQVFLQGHSDSEFALNYT